MIDVKQITVGSDSHMCNSCNGRIPAVPVLSNVTIRTDRFGTEVCLCSSCLKTLREKASNAALAAFNSIYKQNPPSFTEFLKTEFGYSNEELEKLSENLHAKYQR